MIRRVLLLALLVTSVGGAGSAWARSEKASKAAPRPATASAEEKLAKARTEAFAEYEAQLATGQKARAADALVLLIDDPDAAPFHAEALARLGDLLAEVDLPYAALCAYVRAFHAATDADVEEIGTRVPRAIELAAKVGDPAILEAPFGSNLALGRTDDVRGQMAWLAARENFRKRSYGAALGILKLVKQGDPLYPDAKALEGVIFNQQDRPEDALKAFELSLSTGRDRDARFQDVTQLNLARTWFAAGNYPRAIEAYARVGRGSEFWPEAQFERAWSHFRIDDINGTLGVLYSLGTPFFGDWYFPEADLLRVYSMFLLCKFPQAEEEIDRFKAAYAPVHAALRAWAERGEEDAFAGARTFVKTGDTSGLPAMIWRPWRAEDRFRASLAAVESAEDELRRMRNVAANPFTERARSWLDERRSTLVRDEGARVKDRIAAQEAEIGQMLADTEIFVLDILRMKTRLYEQASDLGGIPEAARTVQRGERTRKGWREWPFQGEVWADELGYYRVNVLPECPASMRQSVQ